jgi:hypothetical protein
MMISVMLALCFGQSMIGKANDPLMRPIIPDPYLLAQDWVQRDMGLTPQAISEVQAELAPSGPRIMQASRTGRVIPTPKTRVLAQQHAKRLTELSIRASDLHALTDPGVAAKVGLSSAQQTQVNAKFRTYFKWVKDETARLSRVRQTEISKSVAILGPDPVAARSRVFKLRAEVRSLLTAPQRAKLKSLMGRPPATLASFGWLNQAPYLFLPGYESLLLNRRGHEELGLTMRQSRLLGERLGNNGSQATYLREISGLTQAQRLRLDQIGLQYQGAMALLRCDIVSALGLDDALIDSLVLKVGDMQRQDMDLQSGGGHLSERRKLWDDRDRMLLGTLSPAQRSKWKALLGVPLPEIHPLRP